jgi:hypothetical protein
MTSFSVVAIDVYGPVDSSARGHTFVLGITDLNSAWCEAYAMKTVTAREICENILKFVSYAGIMEVIISDNATGQVAGLGQALYKMLGVELRTSTPFHSTGNAAIERFFGTLKHLLMSLRESGKYKDWDKYLPFLLFCYRNMENELSEYSPYQLVFGKPCRNFLDVLYDIWTNAEYVMPVLSKRDSQYLETVKERIRVCVQSAMGKRKLKEDKYIQRYNEKAREKQFKVGQLVFVLMTDSRRKTRLRWIGPCEIKSKVSDYSYLVYNPEDKSVCLRHANILRGYTPCVNVLGMIESGDEELGEVMELPLKKDVDRDKEDFERRIHEVDLGHLESREREMLLDLLRKHEKVFSDVPGDVKEEYGMCEIKLKPGYEGWRQKPYRVPFKLKSVIDSQVAELLESGRIRESCGQVCHPVVLASKDGGKGFRMAIDFRKLNEATVFECYPMKIIDELTPQLADSRYLTTLDATKGYYQIRMHPNSIHLTSFVTHANQYENIFMPFGLTNSSAIFSRCMDKILKDHKAYSSSYIDDVCCHTKETFEDHVKKLDKVLTSIGDSGMKLKLSKCQFAKPRLKFLGFIIGQGRKDPVPEKLEAFQNLPEPTTKKGVRSLLAVCRYYKAHLPNFSEITVPLSELTRKDVAASFRFNEEQRRAFVKLKECIRNAQTLYTPNYDKPFTICCDASDHTIAGCLSQFDDDGVEHPIEFVSKKLSGSQLLWATVIKEAFAVVYCLQKWDGYIYGGVVNVITDHDPLTYLVSSVPNSPKLLRWVLGLQRWKIVMTHRRGVDNSVPDYFSRYS